jgi:hypothetical protein
LPLDALSTCLFCLRINPGLYTIFKLSIMLLSCYHSCMTSLFPWSLKAYIRITFIYIKIILLTKFHWQKQITLYPLTYKYSLYLSHFIYSHSYTYHFF